MRFLGVILAYIIFGGTSLAAGYLICEKKKIANMLCIGFVANIAALEIISIPCVILKLKFLILLAAYYVFAAVIIALAAKSFKDNNRYRRKRDKEKKKFEMPSLSFDKLELKPVALFFKKHVNVWLIMFVCMVISHVFSATLKTHTDADDSFGIAVSNICVNENRLELDEYAVRDGIGSSDAKTGFICWEFYLGILSKSTGLKPVELAHSFLVPALIVLCYMAIYLLAQALFDDKRRVAAFSFFYALLLAHAGYSMYSTGSFMLLQIWQGKAMLACFILPLLLASCIEIYKGDSSWLRFLENLIIVFAGFGFAFISVYFIPIAYVAFILPLIFYLLFGGEFDELGSVLGKFFLTLIPALGMTGYVFFITKFGKSFPNVDLKWKDVFDKTYDGLALPILTLVCVVIFIIYYRIDNKGRKGLRWFINYDRAYVEEPMFIRKRDSEAGLLFIPISITVLTAATVLNPFLIKIIAKYVVDAADYWRLYWVLPVFTVIAGTFTVFASCFEWISGPVIGLIAIIAIKSTGAPVVTDNNFIEHENAAKIPESMYMVCDKLLGMEDEPVCIFEDYESRFVRQYDTDIKVVGAGNMIGSTREIEGTKYDLGWLYNQAFEDGNLDNPEVIRSLRKLNVKYVFSTSYLENLYYYERYQIASYGYIYVLKN